ncbi:MAG: hypothetical protein IT203_02630 [Fimbriimonadaceae bacterium]|nr:hypothetical protein [Fimbriimonadaceae bacterium]
MQTLAKNAEVRAITIDGTNYTLAAGTSDVNSGAIDTMGYGGVMIVAAVGTMAASSSVDSKLQQSSDNGSSDDYSDILGSALTQVGATDDDKLLIWDVRVPKKRYLRAVFTRGDGGNATINSLIAILYNPAQGAPTYGATVKAIETFSEPAEGTA